MAHLWKLGCEAFVREGAKWRDDKFYSMSETGIIVGYSSEDG